MDMGTKDFRPALEMISPTILSPEMMNTEKRKAIIDLINSKSDWSGLNGSIFHDNSLRRFVLDLVLNTQAHSVVKRVMKSFIDHVQDRYPSLVYVKYGAIKSLPGCPSQFKGHMNKFHLDYSSTYTKLRPDQRPMSIILALDDFEFMYLPHSTLARKDIVCMTVPPAHAICLTNVCLHSDGPNNSLDNKVRFFAHMASNYSHFPSTNKVFKYKWSADDVNDLESVIVFPWKKVGENFNEDDENDDACEDDKEDDVCKDDNDYVVKELEPKNTRGKKKVLNLL